MVRLGGHDGEAVPRGQLGQPGEVGAGGCGTGEPQVQDAAVEQRAAQLAGIAVVQQVQRGVQRRGRRAGVARAHVEHAALPGDHPADEYRQIRYRVGLGEQRQPGGEVVPLGLVVGQTHQDVRPPDRVGIAPQCGAQQPVRGTVAPVRALAQRPAVQLRGARGWHSAMMARCPAAGPRVSPGPARAERASVNSAW